MSCEPKTLCEPVTGKTGQWPVEPKSFMHHGQHCQLLICAVAFGNLVRTVLHLCVRAQHMTHLNKPLKKEPHDFPKTIARVYDLHAHTHTYTHTFGQICVVGGKEGDAAALDLLSP